MTTKPDVQITNAIMMVRPSRFCSNPQTIESNALQAQQGDADDAAIQQQALVEFDALVTALCAAGIEVIVFDDAPKPVTPDALFPNNWLSTHADGTTVLYPMMAENRRLERDYDFLQRLQADHRFRVNRLVELSNFETKSHFLEGTGSLVLDRVNAIAYASLSARTHPEIIREFCNELEYQEVTFHAVDETGVPYYHTNVFMCIARGVAILCSESIVDDQERSKVRESLAQTDYEIVEINRAQVRAFAGNMIGLQTPDGDQILAMSSRAKDALHENQLEILQQYGHIITASIDVIEKYSGGSVRCMIAELFLPRE